MVSSGMLWLMAAGGLSIPLFGQDARSAAPIPSDPLEMVTGQIQAADTPASRQAVLGLLDRARNNYRLPAAGRPYDLKTAFTVNSGGATEYDGAWQMEDTFDPSQGLRWTASAGAAYTITEIATKGTLYAEGTPGYIPLRLQEARAALFGAIPSSALINSAAIRTSTATFQGAPVTCVLLSRSKRAPAAALGRRWDETEDCVDPQSGLLKLHSQVPGRYYAYDYSNAPQLAGHVFPRKAIVPEGGQTISQLSVAILEDLPAADSSLFIPTPEMKERGRGIAMTGAQKVSHIAETGVQIAGAKAHSVCVFGLVTASGQLVEAHSLQPSDPYSQAAVQAANHMNFALPPPPGQIRPPAQQHFVFVIAKFASQ